MSPKHTATSTPSFQRKLESSACTPPESHWIPAFAGMTTGDGARFA